MVMKWCSKGKHRHIATPSAKINSGWTMYCAHKKPKISCKNNNHKYHVYHGGYLAAIQAFCVNFSLVCAFPSVVMRHAFGPHRLKGPGIIIKLVCKEMVHLPADHTQAQPRNPAATI